MRARDITGLFWGPVKLGAIGVAGILLTVWVLSAWEIAELDAQHKPAPELVATKTAQPRQQPEMAVSASGRFMAEEIVPGVIAIIDGDTGCVSFKDETGIYPQVGPTCPEKEPLQ